MRRITKRKISSELFKSPTIEKKGKSEELEIFMNPDKADVREILYSGFSKGVTPYVNFCIDFKHKTTFIWNGEYASHAIACRIIPLNIHEETIVSGIAEILPDARLNALALYQGERNFDAFKWDWLDRYFPKISEEYKMLAKRKIRASKPDSKRSKKIASSLYMKAPHILVKKLIKGGQTILAKEVLKASHKSGKNIEKL